jgi:hypothetical protein
MLHPNPYMVLTGALNFTVADLEANRRGLLTNRQRTYLESQRLKSSEPWGLSMIGLLPLGIVLHMHLMVMVFALCCLVTGIVVNWLRFESDLGGQVLMVSGKLSSIAGQGLGRSGYQIRIGTETFSVSESVKRAFDTALRYRVYYTASTRVILSAELLG